MRKFTARELIEDELSSSPLSALGPKSRFKLKLPKRPKEEDEEEEDKLQESRFGPGTKVDIFVPIFFSAHLKEEWYDTEAMLDKLEDIDWGIKERVEQWMHNDRDDGQTFDECPSCGEEAQEGDDYACKAGEPCASCGYDPVEESDLAPEGDWEAAFDKFIEGEFGGRGGGWPKFLESYGASNQPMRYIGDYDVDEAEVEMLLTMIQEEWNAMNTPDPEQDPDGEYTWPSIIRNHGSEFPEKIRNSIRECSITDYKEIKGTPGVIVTFVFGEVLDADTLELLREWVIGQGSDGFGEGFEQRDLRKELDTDMFEISINMFSRNQKSGPQVGLKPHEVDYDDGSSSDYPPVQIVDVQQVPSDFKAAVQSMKGKLKGMIKKTGEKIKRGVKTATTRVRNAGRALQGKPPINTESLVCKLAS